MTVVYKVRGQEFWNKETAEKYEKLPLQDMTVKVEKTLSLIPMDKLKEVFAIGSVCNLKFYIRDCEDDSLEEDGWYETNSIDETGHLNCTDLEHGLLEWYEEEKCYYRTVHGYSWKVDILGISSVSYA